MSNPTQLTVLSSQAQSDLRALHDDWIHCQRCSLGKTANKHVLWEFSEVGNNDNPNDLDWVREGPTVLLIGEGPGKSEDTLGRPFIGPAGKLLRAALEEADPPTPDTYSEGTPGVGGHEGAGYFEFAFTNLVACRPCDYAGGPNREPYYTESEACSPRLEKLIQIIDPVGIIACGLVPQVHLAINHTLEKAGWTPEPLKSGGWMADPYLRIKHPAWILRNGGKSSPYYVEYVQTIKDYFDSLKAYI